MCENPEIAGGRKKGKRKQRLNCSIVIDVYYYMYRFELGGPFEALKNIKQQSNGDLIEEKSNISERTTKRISFPRGMTMENRSKSAKIPHKKKTFYIYEEHSNYIHNYVHSSKSAKIPHGKIFWHQVFWKINTSFSGTMDINPHKDRK